MVHNWKVWCRLCAEDDPTKMNTKITLKSELESTFLDALSDHFSIDLNLCELPQTICMRCHEYVREFINFSIKTARVQTMFNELLINENELDLEQLKARYEQSDVKLDMPDPKPCIGEFEFIDEDMVHVPQIKTEEEDESDNETNASDKDWKPDDDSSHDEAEGDDDQSTKCPNGRENEDSQDKKEVKRRGRPKKNPEDFNCSLCPTISPSYAKYARHMLKVHEVTPEPLPFACSKCSKTFTTEKLCQKHELTHESPQQKITNCPYCNQEFKKNKLRGHIRESHAGARPFVCDDCGKAYTTFGNLKEHKLTHSDERPFKCRYCEKGFKNKPRLRTHEDTHNDTNYICTCCGLQLNTRRTLNMHMLVHSEEKQHKCDICGKAYKRAKNLKIHLIMHAGLKSYMCTFCDKTFTCNANCRIHMKKIHPVELAKLEASGAKISNANIPKMKDLREVISKKNLFQDSTGSMELDSTSSSVPLGGNDNQAILTNTVPAPTATMSTPTSLSMQNHEQQSSYFSLNRMNFGQLNAS